MPIANRRLKIHQQAASRCRENARYSLEEEQVEQGCCVSRVAATDKAKPERNSDALPKDTVFFRDTATAELITSRGA
jgi:hypothetical protein